MAQELDRVRIDTQEGMSHDTILNELGELPLEIGGTPVVDLLRPAYDAMAEAVAAYVLKSTPAD
jgi:hypothetical protein